METLYIIIDKKGNSMKYFYIFEENAHGLLVFIDKMNYNTKDILVQKQIPKTYKRFYKRD